MTCGELARVVYLRQRGFMVMRPTKKIVTFEPPYAPDGDDLDIIRYMIDNYGYSATSVIRPAYESVPCAESVGPFPEHRP